MFLFNCAESALAKLNVFHYNASVVTCTGHSNESNETFASEGATIRRASASVLTRFARTWINCQQHKRKTFLHSCQRWKIGLFYEATSSSSFPAYHETIALRSRTLFTCWIFVNLAKGVASANSFNPIAFFEWKIHCSSNNESKHKQRHF